ncbi:hypothetical protein DFS34DRAFT_311188 [Phlyctochytrium arcticum]|nr:hypothetical protein DFS34DRAFT_311188 [Phlyctochytrium arcticum]
MLWNQLHESTEDLIICGTPGVGKTYFCLYLIWMIQKTYPEATIVMERQTGPCLVFCPDGRCLSFDSKDSINAGQYLDSECNWYIVDDTEVSFPASARTVLVASPCYIRFKRFEEQQMTTMRWMPTWDLDELHSLQAMVYPETAWEDVKARASFWGGVPLTVPDEPEGDFVSDPLAGEESLLGITDLRKCFKCEGRENFPTAAVSGRILHLITKFPYEEAVLQLASIQMVDILLRKFGAEFRTDILRFSPAASENPTVRLY